ncbi:MAG: DUF3619 family protein [Rhodoferax sp.]|nr:DUF3619 family protein [Rhodoferax sp.]
MSSLNTKHRPDELPAALDAAGRQLASHLMQSVDELTPNTKQRLRAAREQAVDKRRQVLAAQAQTVWRQAAQGPSDHGWFEQHAPAWQFLGSIGMVFILVFGLWTIDNLESDEFVSETAEIDKLLLTDDLPPAAYLDPGFKHFLKLSFPSNSR